MVYRKQKSGKEAKELEAEVKKKMEEVSNEEPEETPDKKQLLEEKIKKDKEELEKLEKEKEEIDGEILVVKEIPTQEVRQVKKEDGSIVNLVTVEEALTKLINE